MKKLDMIIRLETKSQKKKGQGLQIIDQKEIPGLSLGAEMSSENENEEDEQDEGRYYYKD